MIKYAPKSALWLILLASSIFQNLQAQNQIAGTLQDATRQPVSFATVLLLSATDSALVRGAFSTSEGDFLFDNVPPGSFLCQFSMLGFQSVYSKTITLTEKTARLNLETVTMEASTAMLGEVSIVAKRPFLEQKIDRTVVNVANSITNAGGTALQVLQRSPGVQVNQQTKSIALAGKEGVVIMINGKIERQPIEAVMQMLESMNADNIDRIELIHTPPANFEAEGNAGIINIILKSSSEAGLNGGYSVKGGYARRANYGASTYFNFRKNKFNLFGSYDYNQQHVPQVFTNYRRSTSGNDILETDTYSDRFHTPTAVQSARFGMDYQMSKKTVVGVLGSFFDRNWSMDAESVSKNLKNGVLESSLRMPNSEINHTRSFTGNVNLTHQITQTQSLNLDADLIRFDISNPSHYNVLNLDNDNSITSQYQLRITKEMPVHVAVAKADYTRSFGKNGRLESGAKITMLRFNNDVRVGQRNSEEEWVTIADLTSLSHLNEQVLGAYSSVSFKIKEKINIKAGLRYEHTHSRLDSAEQPNIVDRRYGSWFPSIFVTRKLNEKQSLNLSYSRRTTRPTMRQLAPGFVFFDPTTLQTGNTALRPAFTDALKLDYTLHTYRFGVSYSATKNLIRWIPMIDAISGRQVTQPQNIHKERVASANLYVPFHPTKWWEMQQNCFINAREITFMLNGQKLQNSKLEYGFNSTQRFTLPRSFALEVSGNYNSPSAWGVNKIKANGSANVAIQKDFGAKWGKLRCAATDLFVTDNWFFTAAQPDIDLYVKGSWQFSRRTFMLSWTNTFGNRKLKSSRQRQVGSAEEMGRI
jgi:outer membrane receptor protein involved in Fe transport